jgi:aspartyl-tRNA(Asn)/glutamyl-tRNA(Gln) amidotransferase subunit B
LSEADAESFDVSVTPEELAEIVTMYGDGIINSSTAKTLISMTPDSDLSPAELVAKHGLAQINDKDVLRSALLRVIKEAPKLLDDYKNGKLAAKNAIVGKVMAATRGRANPVLLDEIFGQVTK